MRLLVTGGAGFIGSNFVHYWLDRYPDDQITVLDLLTYAGREENIADIYSDPRFTFIRGDIRKEGDVRYAMDKGVDVVVHFAAESHVDRSIMDDEPFFGTNTLGTRVLLSESLKHNIKLFHHVSTDEVFGALPLGRPDLKFNEESNYKPNSPYATSKAAADLFVRSYNHTYGLPTTITNTSNNYGPNQFPEKLIPFFVTNLIEGKKVPLMGKGENVRDWCHVEDHCRAIDLVIHAALEDKSFIGETFCVGGDAERTNLEITKAILKIMGKDESSIEFTSHRLAHDSRYAIDSSKIKKELGWRPEHELDYWFEKTVQWYIENEKWWRPLKEGAPRIDPAAQIEMLEQRKRGVEDPWRRIRG